MLTNMYSLSRISSAISRAMSMALFTGRQPSLPFANVPKRHLCYFDRIAAEYAAEQSARRQRAAAISYVNEILDKIVKQLSRPRQPAAGVSVDAIRKLRYEGFFQLAKLNDSSTTDKFLPELQKAEKLSGPLSFWEEYLINDLCPSFSTQISRFCNRDGIFYSENTAHKAHIFCSKSEMIQVIRAFIAALDIHSDLSQEATRVFGRAVSRLKMLSIQTTDEAFRGNIGTDLTFAEIAELIQGESWLDEEIKNCKARVQRLGNWICDNLDISDTRNLQEQLIKFLKAVKEPTVFSVLMGPVDIEAGLRLIDSIDDRKKCAATTADVFRKSVSTSASHTVLSPGCDLRKVFGVSGDNKLKQNVIADLEAILALRAESIKNNFSREEFDQRFERIGIVRYDLLHKFGISYHYRSRSEAIVTFLDELKRGGGVLNNEVDAYNFFVAMISFAKQGHLSDARGMARDLFSKHPCDPLLAAFDGAVKSDGFPGEYAKLCITIPESAPASTSEELAL